jgi:hypothetical protein
MAGCETAVIRRSFLTAMTFFVLFAATAWTRIIPSRLIDLRGTNYAFRFVEIHCPPAFSYSRGVFVNTDVFFRSSRRYSDSEEPCAAIGSIGTNLCQDANGVRSFDRQRGCARFIVDPGPVNLDVVSLKPNEERVAFPG